MTKRYHFRSDILPSSRSSRQYCFGVGIKDDFQSKLALRRSVMRKMSLLAERILIKDILFSIVLVFDFFKHISSQIALDNSDHASSPYLRLVYEGRFVLHR